MPIKNKYSHENVKLRHFGKITAFDENHGFSMDILVLFYFTTMTFIRSLIISSHLSNLHVNYNRE